MATPCHWRWDGSQHAVRPAEPSLGAGSSSGRRQTVPPSGVIPPAPLRMYFVLGPVTTPHNFRNALVQGLLRPVPAPPATILRRPPASMEAEGEAAAVAGGRLQTGHVTDPAL